MLTAWEETGSARTGVARNWKFESIFLQRRVCELSVPLERAELIHPANWLSKAVHLSARKAGRQPVFGDAEKFYRANAKRAAFTGSRSSKRSI
jgi:hypothetical protein